ncbi:MAG: pyruvate kinase [Xenococcaceae cyanobacterium MO_167.B52]|nr:pyruvate kinase [Xenococcaceae cyanobacterium MO_167.B52]
MATYIAPNHSFSINKPTEPQVLLRELQRIRQMVIHEGEETFRQWQPSITRHSFVDSALNLAHYLALRHEDLRQLQVALMPWGLSSLGRIEGRVLPNLDAVIATLGMVCQQDPRLLPHRPPLDAFYSGDRYLAKNTEAVFGKPYNQRRVRIMVTLPTEAADNYNFVRELVKRGTDCIRINCAHDTPQHWLAMIKNLRQAESELGRSCKVFMDIGGPKPRLGTVLLSKNKQRIHQGDKLLLSEKAPLNADKKIFQANCTIPEILFQLQLDNQVWIDDGKIGGKVKSILPEGVLLEITHARSKGEKLRPDKGINFPDTVLTLNPLTSKDQQDLDFIATHADIIGYSFVQEATDIELLQLELQARLGANSCQPAIVAKIETAEAVKNLPELIVHAAGKQPFGVMIARGDLAVEIGYQRLAEIQEEILWLCQAAHVPVIWATQVLENLVKKRTPSRAEMTDAAMAERAECVMLNKGAYITEALTILDDVLNRMEAHQSKKTPQLRALRSW